MKRQKIVLYNPRAPFFTMPLALLAVGSRLDPAKYEVCVIDGRLESEPIDAVLRELSQGQVLCLGMTVLTGAPIRDAMYVTRAAKARRPDVPVIWGGWHPSLFPTDTLSEARIDGVVVGQGEETFAEIVDHLAVGEGLEGIAGTVSTKASDGSPGATVRGGSRGLVDINRLPAHDYTRIPVERYFALKGQRQLDYISSQGCRFRCTFCADPYVYGRSWSGLEPERMAEELELLWRRYDVQDVGFQDETFFTSTKRVAAVAEQFLRRSVRFTWMATMRADQGSRLDEAVLAECRRAGLRRVMIGLESGSQPMLDWMKKDIKIGQVFESAEKCRRHGIGVLFNLIVGFPDEPPESVAQTLAIATELRAMGPDFQVAIFYYKPYPGSEIADMLVRRGCRLPRTLTEWADFDDVASPSPWVDWEKHERIERFKFYQQIGWARSTPLRAPLQALARWRCRRDRYGLPIEKTLIQWLRPQVPT